MGALLHCQAVCHPASMHQAGQVSYLCQNDAHESSLGQSECLCRALRKLSILESIQGGIDEGESPGEAAARELQEETGILQASIISQVINDFARGIGVSFATRDCNSSRAPAVLSAVHLASAA